MRHFLAIVVVAIASLAAAGHPSFAEDEEFVLANELVEITRGDGGLEGLVDSMWGEQVKLFRLANPSVSDETLNELKVSFLVSVRSIFEDLKGDMAFFYAAEFSLEELRDLVTFYEGPLGAHFLEANAIIVHDASPRMMEQLYAALPGLIAQLHAEAKKKGIEVQA